MNDRLILSLGIICSVLTAFGCEPTDSNPNKQDLWGKGETPIGVSSVALLVQTESAVLAPSDPKKNMHFGRTMAAYGNTIAVGAVGDMQYGVDSGSVYLFAWDSQDWTPQAKLLPGNLGPGDSFGSALALNDDSLLVGAYLAHQATGAFGSVYAYERAGAGWQQIDELYASDPEGLALFGYAVAMHGKRAAVGAMQSSDHKGAVYVFTKGADGHWSETSKLMADDGMTGDMFGISVAINNDIIVASAGSAPCTQGIYCGAAYVFEFDGSQWKQAAKLVPSDVSPWDFFGHAVSVMGTRVLVSTYSKHNTDGTNGAVYVFDKQGDTWIETAKIAPAGRKPGDGFGTSLAEQNGRIFIGACMREVNGVPSGAASIFGQHNGQWTEERWLNPSNGQAADSFGCTLSLSGDTLVIGAGDANTAFSDTGAAYVYALQPGLTDGEPCSLGSECASGSCCPSGAQQGAQGICCLQSSSGGTSGGTAGGGGVNPPCDPTTTPECDDSGSGPQGPVPPLGTKRWVSEGGACMLAAPPGTTHGYHGQELWIGFLFLAGTCIYRWRRPAKILFRSNH